MTNDTPEANSRKRIMVVDDHPMMRAGLTQFGPKTWLLLFCQILERILLVGLINGAVASAYLAVNSDSGASAPAVTAP